MRITSQKDFAAGLMYIAAGLGFAIVASTYHMGTPTRMGPGYFPFWLGVILAVLGAVVLFNALRPTTEEDRVTRWDLKSLAVILSSVVVFGFLLIPMGLIASVIALVVLASLASHEFTWTATLLNTIVLVAISLVVFVYGLGLRFPVWPAFIGG